MIIEHELALCLALVTLLTLVTLVGLTLARTGALLLALALTLVFALIFTLALSLVFITLCHGVLQLQGALSRTNIVQDSSHLHKCVATA